MLLKQVDATVPRADLLTGGGRVTIAGLYLTQEGIVLGADSTSSFLGDEHLHYFNFAQKLFEVGENSTFGLLAWGVGHIGEVSYRRLAALLGDDLAKNPPSSIDDVAARWVKLFKPVYDKHPPVVDLRESLRKAKQGKGSEEDDEKRRNLEEGYAVGFCVAGHCMPDRVPGARIILFTPASVKHSIERPALNELHLWGMPNVMNRLRYGVDQPFINALLASGKWIGTPDDLTNLLAAHGLQPRARLPMRDAIDYVHSAIYCTIKAMKFSTDAQVCGGPIEIAVITSDRRFRWVRHKPWDAAIEDGDFS